MDPSYLTRHALSPPGTGHDLLTLSVHYMHRDHEFLVGETAWKLEQLPMGEIVASTDSYLALTRFCEAGMGLALLPEILGEASDTLVRFDRRETAPVCDLWLVGHSETGSTARVRAFLDFIKLTFDRRFLPSPKENDDALLQAGDRLAVLAASEVWGGQG
jgi:DNA-binding transcriptional LysR family regulator